MSFVTAALIGGGATILGGMLSSNAANSAASSAANSANQANATQWNMYNQNRTDQAPWRNAGGSAVNQLGYLMGLGGYDPSMIHQGTTYDANGNLIENGQDQLNGATVNQGMGGYGSMMRNFGMGDYQADPGYQFRLEQGQKALERAGARSGNSLSGSQLKGMADYNQGMASQEYGNAYNRFMQNRQQQFGQLSNLAGLGSSSVGQTGQLGANTANQVSNNTMGAATVGANAGMASAGAWGNALNNGVNQWNQYTAMNGGQSGAGNAQAGYNAWLGQGPLQTVPNGYNGQG